MFDETGGVTAYPAEAPDTSPSAEPSPADGVRACLADRSPGAFEHYAEAARRRLEE